VILVIAVILVALLVHGCQVSERNSALKDYTNNVSSVISQSNKTGKLLFELLASGEGQSNATNLQNQINEKRSQASIQLDQARKIGVPDQVKGANQNVVLALQMRLDGITNIASDIQPALDGSAKQEAINTIAAEIARFYASDVLYKDYAAPAIAGALHGAGIAVGAPNGETIAGGQFVTNVEWLTPPFIATELNVALPSSGKAKIAPGLHGHALNSVSVDGTTLQTGSTNTIPASPAPTFSLNFTNGGTNNETDVVAKVTVTGTSVSGQTVVPETTAGQTYNTKVTLSTTPPVGTHTVVATIEKVPGEKNLANNTLSFPVTFK
jgi:hypothetical protein